MRTTETHVYFYSEIELYSNFHRCEFTDPNIGRVFQSTEQAFMFYKADFFRDSAIAATLLNTQEPSQAKVFGRQIRNYNDSSWDIMRYAYMVYVNYLKFSQNPAFKKQLLETGERVLAEASPSDLIWGIGLLQADDNILDESMWKGHNLLGKSLMEVR
ncbi:MAG: NADAR family protein, partial [bacterium]|nr:NADAR family protein [bacterium]